MTFLTNPVRDLCPAYAAGETLWYLSGSSKVDMMLAYAKTYGKYADTDGIVHGAYGPRMLGPLYKCIQILKADPWSRQAIVPIWNKFDTEKANLLGQKPEHKIVPCTLSFQFLIRDDAVHMITTMRSNDVWLGFPYDVFAFTCIQRVVADALGLEYGIYTHQVGSMHMYERDKMKCDEAYRKYHTTSHTLCWPSNWNPADIWNCVFSATALEALGRKGVENGLCYTREKYEEDCGVMLADLAFATWQKNRPGVLPQPRSKVLCRQYS
jgi:hypothetical protein